MVSVMGLGLKVGFVTTAGKGSMQAARGNLSGKNVAAQKQI